MAQPTRCTILWNNVAPSSSAYTAHIGTNFEANFPITNLYGEDVHKVARTTSQGSKYYRIDLGSNSLSYDTAVFAVHNVSANATVKLGIDPSSYVSPTVFMSIGYNCWYYYWDTIQTDRYIIMLITDAVGIPFQQIGVWWVGARLELARNPQIPMGLKREKETTRLVTGGGVHWSYEEHTKLGYDLKFIENFEASGAGMYASLEEALVDRGKVKPFFIDLKPGDSNTPPMFVHSTDWDFSIDGKDARPGTWSVEEEK